jgi:hypothetical protein
VSYDVEQLAAVRRDVADLKRNQVTYRKAIVTAVDATAATFAADIDGVGVVAGIASPIDQLPALGDTVQVAVSGATPVYQPGRPAASVSTTSGRQTSNTSPEGVASFQRVESAEDPVFQGVALGDMLDRLPRGMVGYGGVSLASTPGIGTGEFGIVEVAFTPEAGRSYEVKFQDLALAGTVADDDVWLWVRYSTDGTKPNGGYPSLVGPVYDHAPAATRFQHYQFSSFLLGLPANAGPQPMYRLLVTVARGAGGSGTLTALACNPVVRVLDTGLNVVNTGVINTGSGGSSTAVQNYDVSHDALWSQTYNASGNPYTRYGSELGQGNDSTAGNMRSMCGFPDLTAGLTGATIDLVELSFYTNYTALGTGTASVGTHGVNAASAPASFSGTTNLFTMSGWARNQRKTVDVTSWAASLQSGAIRGFTVGPASLLTSDYYMWWNGAAMTNPPRLRIKYKK